MMIFYDIVYPKLETSNYLSLPFVLRGQLMRDVIWLLFCAEIRNNMLIYHIIENNQFQRGITNMKHKKAVLLALLSVGAVSVGAYAANSGG